MPKPCNHKSYEASCRICFWSTDISDKGKAYRKMWNISEDEIDRTSSLAKSYTEPTRTVGLNVLTNEFREQQRISKCRECIHYYKPLKKCMKIGKPLVDFVSLANSKCPIDNW